MNEWGKQQAMLWSRVVRERTRLEAHLHPIIAFPRVAASILVDSTAPACSLSHSARALNSPIDNRSRTRVLQDSISVTFFIVCRSLRVKRFVGKRRALETQFLCRQ